MCVRVCVSTPACVLINVHMYVCACALGVGTEEMSTCDVVVPVLSALIAVLGIIILVAVVIVSAVCIRGRQRKPSKQFAMYCEPEHLCCHKLTMYTYTVIIVQCTSVYCYSFRPH